MIEIKGKAGIVAKILADSISPSGVRLISYELTYPRIIHSELLTHKMLCSNSASSRAIPFAKMAKQLTARPVRFGQANPGMQDKGEDFDALVADPQRKEYGVRLAPEAAWEQAKDDALEWAKRFYSAQYHKQVYNRLTEPFQMMKTVLSGTEFENFFWLRNHEAADPTLHELARCMFEAREQSKPVELKAGEWQLPYVTVARRFDGKRVYLINEDSEYGPDEISLEDAIKVSCARTAAVSFRNEDYGLEKCLEVYDKLVGDERKHASAMQHAATPMSDEYLPRNTISTVALNVPHDSSTWQKGISHVDREGNLWSGQFKNWIMHRKTIEGENYSG